MRITFLYIVLVLVFASCKKKEIGPQCPSCEEGVTSSTQDVLVGCEGNFGWGNASISLYDPSTQNASQQVFQNINGFALGDVMQSFCRYQDMLYIVVNNSGKIEVIDTANYVSQATIAGLTSPRSMVTHGNRAYVSDLYSSNVSILNLDQNSIIGSISVGRWSEDLLVADDMLYIGCPDTTWVLKYDLTNSTFVDTIEVGKGPSGIQQSSDGTIWFLNTGGFNQEIPRLTKYDGSAIVQSYSFGSITDNPTQLTYDPKTHVLYYLNNGIYAFDVTANQLPTQPVIASNGSVYYGLGVDPHNSDVYITDAIDYIQPGRVLRFDSLYQPIDTFSTGIIPQAIWFK